MCLPRTHLLVGMACDGILTVVGWQSLISGNSALISGNLDEKNDTTMDQTEATVSQLTTTKLAASYY